MTQSASAPAKAILFGEHAVVYGMPAIALPLPQLRAYAEYQPGGRDLLVSGDHLASFRLSSVSGDAPGNDPIQAMILATARRLGVGEISGQLRIRSDIPIASGLGSGAAVSAALGRAIAALLERELPAVELNALVYAIEKLHHGKPSGIDNTVVVYERPVYFVKDQQLDFLSVAGALRLLIADSGVAALTRETVAHVRQLRQSQPAQTAGIIREIGAIAEGGRALLERGDSQELGRLMTLNHALLQVLELSSPLLDRLVAAASQAGAYGAKLTGGGRGGNIIALVDETSAADVEAALRIAGAKRVFASSLQVEARA